MKPSMLILGGDGLVGSTLYEFSLKTFSVHSTSRNSSNSSNPNFINLDLIKDRNEINKIISNQNPDVIVHTVAHSSVDLCETDHKIADLLHIDITKEISDIAKNLDSKLIFLSTDAVFNGNQTQKFTENDVPEPVNYYGKTKLDAEKIVLESSKKNVVLRTAVIYGWHERSRFTNWILSYLKKEKIVDPFKDQFNTPTLVDDLVESIQRIIQQKISGLFHATGKSCVNRYDFALLLSKHFGLEKSLIKPVTKNEKKQDAPRPFRTCLDSSKLEKTINFDFHDIDSGIQVLYKKAQENPSLWEKILENN